MPSRNRELERRLPWVLVFRAGIATALFVLTVVSEFADLPIRPVSGLLYGVALGSYVVVMVLGLMLRAGTSALVLSAVYLAFAVAAAFIAVQASGGVDSELTFLYLLTILDAAIIGGRPVAMAVATSCSLVYGGQLALVMYDILPVEGARPVDWTYTWSFVSHVVAYYLVALLASYLAELMQRAREAASVAASDLQHAHELHEVILESLPVGVLTVDAQLGVRTANKSATRLLGHHRLVGQRLEPALAEAMRAPSGRELELFVGNERRQIAVGHAPLPPEAGKQLEVLVLEDRTTRAELERSLQSKARLASIGELAAAIAHELRNPLAAISGAVELMGSGGDQARLQEIVSREIARLDKLIEDFLLYARPAPAERARIDVAALVRELCEVLRADGAWSTRTLTVVTPERLEAEIDPRQWRQLLWNLLRNACDAAPAGSTVELRLVEQAGGMVLEVLDRGTGVDPSIRPHLFEPFRTTKVNGTGLGLAVVHRIVENHGGQVELVPAPAGGTVARVTLPA